MGVAERPDGNNERAGALIDGFAAGVELDPPRLGDGQRVDRGVANGPDHLGHAQTDVSVWLAPGSETSVPVMSSFVSLGETRADWP